MSGPAMAGSPTDVLVAIPAHNEEDLIAECLGHVLAALHHARSTGSIGRAVVAVAAHRCADRTAEVARRVLGVGGSGVPQAGPTVEAVVVEDEASATIADVRRAAVEAGARRIGHGDGAGAAASAGAGAGAGAGARGVWLFNTDADSLVPPEWITASLQVAAQEQAVAVAGLVEVSDWNPPAHARHDYDALVARGIRGSGHDHAYGANLPVRLDAYRAVGGFTTRRHGEDRDLLRRLRSAGFRVATPLAPRVSTSAREDPRCPDGLGALLRRLAEQPGPAPRLTHIGPTI